MTRPLPPGTPRSKFSPTTDWQRILVVAENLLRHPAMLKQLALENDVTERTIYRWLDRLEQAGWDVVRRHRNGRILLSIESRPVRTPRPAGGFVAQK